MMKEQLKKWLPDILAIVLFVVISFAYFFRLSWMEELLHKMTTLPSLVQVRKQANTKETTGKPLVGQTVCLVVCLIIRLHRATIHSMIENCPQYLSTIPSQLCLVGIHHDVWILHFDACHENVGLALHFGCNIWAFSSYFFIIITAGHIWKFVTFWHTFHQQLQE